MYTKRFLTLILIIILSVLYVNISYADFNDVNNAHLNFDAIQYVKGESIVKGYDDGTYKPDQKINRAEFLKIIIESIRETMLKENPQTEGFILCDPDLGNIDDVIDFSDVNVNEWYAQYVCAGVYYNIVNGYPDGSFKPDQNISFVEAAKIIVLAFDYDVSQDTEQWFRPFVENLGGRMAIPTTVDSFEKNVTRGEMAEIIFRLKNSITTKLSKTYNNLAGIEEEKEPPVPICVDECGNDICQEIVCLAQGCPCSENTNSCPEDCTVTVLEDPEYLEYSQDLYDSYLGEVPFVINFHADWCPICRNLESKILPDLQNFPDGTKILKANYDTETELKQKYGVTIQTTLIVIDGNGEVVTSLYNPSIESLKNSIRNSIVEE